MAFRIRWLHLTTAPDQLTAEMWSELLRNEGLPTMVHTGHVSSSHLGISGLPCRIMVPEDQLEEAKRLLEERLGPDAPA